MNVNDMFRMVGRDPIKAPPPIDEQTRRMDPRLAEGPITPAATPEDQLAREVVAQIEREDGWFACAVARLRGAYDGDTEHRIALAAIKVARAGK